MLCVAASALTVITEPDTGWYLRSGAYLLKTHSFPLHDPFSYTSKEPWINQHWLTEILFYVTVRAGGYVGLGLLQALTFGLTLLGVGRLAGRRAIMAGLSPVFFVACAAYLREWVALRAQLFSNLLFAVTLLLVMREWRDPSPPAQGLLRHRLRFIAPIAVLWTQLHAGTPYCIALCGLLFLARPSRRLLFFVAVAIAATVVGPFGWRVLMLYNATGITRDLIREWSPLFGAISGGGTEHVFFIVLWLVGIVAIVMRHRRGEKVRFDALVHGVFGLATVYHVRMAPLAVLVSLAVTLPWTQRLAAGWLGTRLDRVLCGTLCVTVFCGAVAASSRKFGFGFAPERFPTKAVAFLQRERPPGPMFNSYNFGGYLMWVYPEERVFIDGRATTVYPESMFQQLLSIYARPQEFAGLVRTYDLRLAVLQRRGKGAALLHWLRGQPGWRVAYDEDPVAVVLLRGPSD